MLGEHIGPDKFFLYAILGDEVCPTTNTPHLQCYFRLRNDSSLDNLVKKFDNFLGYKNTIAFKQADGNAAACRLYCSKDGTFVEFGESPAGQGKRSDLKEVSDLVLAGANLSDIALSHGPSFIKYHNGIAKMISTISASRDWETEVYWLWGPTGSGKTRWVHETCDRSDLYVKDGTNKWFCGYTGQRNVLFDDFRPSTEIPFSRLLRLLDRYSMQVETKGGTVNFNPVRIFITTPKIPAETFQHIDWIKDEDIRQLTRRITKVIEFSDAMRMMPFDLIPLVPPTANVWEHSVAQELKRVRVVQLPSVTCPPPVTDPTPVDVSVAPPPPLVRQKRMPILKKPKPLIRQNCVTPNRSTLREILDEPDSGTEPSDAENIDENEERSDDSGSEGSLCEFLNNGSVTESDYSSDSSTEDQHLRHRKRASKRKIIKKKIARRTIDSDSD